MDLITLAKLKFYLFEQEDLEKAAEITKNELIRIHGCDLPYTSSPNSSIRISLHIDIQEDGNYEKFIIEIKNGNKIKQITTRYPINFSIVNQDLNFNFTSSASVTLKSKKEIVSEKVEVRPDVAGATTLQLGDRILSSEGAHKIKAAHLAATTYTVR